VWVKIYIKMNVKINEGDNMERIVGIDKIRPKLGEYLEKAEKGEVLIVSSRSEPKGVIIGYSAYNELKSLARRAKQLEVAQILDKFRDRAEKAGLSESEIQKEIEEVRNAGGD
jgi:prevent-host-death family protein